LNRSLENIYSPLLARSGSYKRTFICKMRELYREAYWYGCDIPVSSFPLFAQNVKKADIFTSKELTKMKLVGHTTVGMTEYYNKRVIDESLADISGADTAVQYPHSNAGHRVSHPSYARSINKNSRLSSSRSFSLPMVPGKSRPLRVSEASRRTE
jgi:hypothetical protein